MSDLGREIRAQIHRAVREAVAEGGANVAAAVNVDRHGATTRVVASSDGEVEVEEHDGVVETRRRTRAPRDGGAGATAGRPRAGRRDPPA